MSQLTVSSIREQNISAIYRILLEGPLERSELARRVGVSVMTVGNLIEVLQQADVLTEQKVTGKVVGRRPSSLSIHETGHYIVLMDITTRKFQYRLLDMACRLVASDEFFCSAEKPLVMEFKRFLAICKDKAGRIPGGNIIGVGIDTSGIYDPVTDTISCIALPELTDFRIKETVGQYFPVQTVVGEDVKLAAYNFQLRRNVKNMVYLYAGDGIGSGLVLNGAVYNGSGRFSGEIGQVRYMDTTFEKIICFPAFLKRVEQEFPAECLRGARGAIEGLWRGGNERFEALLNEFSGFFAEMLSTFYYILSPELIVMDGDYNMFGQKWVDMLHAKLLPLLFNGEDVAIELVQDVNSLSNSLNGLALQVAIQYVTSL